MIEKTGNRPHLSPRQKQTLQLIWDGMTSEEIAHKLDISGRTVHGLVKDLMQISGTGNRVLLVRWAIQHELVQV
jgi:DNA-binding CsgD family transcriptional regulator